MKASHRQKQRRIGIACLLAVSMLSAKMWEQARAQEVPPPAPDAPSLPEPAATPAESVPLELPPAPASAVDPSAPLEPLPQPASPPSAAPDPATAAPTEPKPPAAQYSEESAEWIGSIMFSITDIHRLNEFMTALAEGRNPLLEQAAQNEEDFLEVVTAPPAPTGPEAEATPPSFPGIFLSSILFISPEEWTVWVNGKRMDQKNPVMDLEGTLKVVSLDKSKVHFTWMPTSSTFEYTRASWNQSLQDDVIKKVVTTSDPIEMDADKGEFSFTLRPNQKLVTKEMKIIEGQTYFTRPIPERLNRQPQGSSLPEPPALEAGQEGAAADPAIPGQRSPEEIAEKLIGQYKQAGESLGMIKEGEQQ